MNINAWGSLFRSARFKAGRGLFASITAAPPAPSGFGPPRPALNKPYLTPRTVAVITTAPPRMPATLRLARRRSGMVASLQEWNRTLRSRVASTPGPLGNSQLDRPRSIIDTDDQA